MARFQRRRKQDLTGAAAKVCDRAAPPSTKLRTARVCRARFLLMLAKWRLPIYRGRNVGVHACPLDRLAVFRRDRAARLDAAGGRIAARGGGAQQTAAPQAHKIPTC